MKTLRVDDKWSIEYDPDANDRPTNWLRYGNMPTEFNEKNNVVALFYALLKIEQEQGE